VPLFFPAYGKSKPPALRLVGDSGFGGHFLLLIREKLKCQFVEPNLSKGYPRISANNFED
jgi:hypothetical protein